jgi:hypothetical protein
MERKRSKERRGVSVWVTMDFTMEAGILMMGKGKSVAVQDQGVTAMKEIMVIEEQVAKTVLVEMRVVYGLLLLLDL